MIFAFTKTNNLGSWLIRWGTSDSFFSLNPVSHFMLIFENGIVMQSVFTGTQIEWKKAALKKRIMVSKAELREALSPEEEKELFEAMANKLVGAHYDWKGIVFFGLFSLWRKWVQLWGSKAPDYPVKNPWGEIEDFMCMELIKPLSHFLSEKKNVEIFIDDLDLTMIDPARCLKIMMTRKDLIVEDARSR